MRYLYLFTTILLLFTTSSCKKFVEIGPPKSELATNNVFNDNGTANSAILAIYSQMVSGDASPYRIPFTTGLSSDELTNNNSSAVDIYINYVDPVNSFFANSLWTAAYNYIYQANAIYEGCKAPNSLDPEVKKQLSAEAVFLRAYWHFFLVNLYGEIPVITSTDYSRNSVASRTSIAKVYDQIIADLKYSEANLNENYVGADAIKTSEERVRPNKSTATALLARVYLYTGKYSEAEAEATALINQSSRYNVMPLNKVFLANSKEAIWQLMPVNGSLINTVEGVNFIPDSSTPVAEEKAEISPQLISSFEPNDLRNSNWIGTYLDTSATPGKSYFYPNKYKVRSGSSYSEYSMIFRISEQYLIRAEARAQLGSLFASVEDLDIIRDRAGLPKVKDTNPGIDKESLITKIFHERQTELFTEQGHRWFDLKRSGKVDAVMALVTPTKGGVWNNNMSLWPIPNKELLNDRNLNQNKGY